MKEFKCSICGFSYDEAAGLPDNGIAPGTKWEEIPQDFVCPWCGAPRSAFEVVENAAEDIGPLDTAENEFENLRELTAGEISAVCSNLAKGCEKQRLEEEAVLFSQLADFFKNKEASRSGKGFQDIAALLNNDLTSGFTLANTVAASHADRGALRALVWSEKVSKMQKALLARYASEGEALLENTKIYVCDICGFIYVGDHLPAVCPVCKVPDFKILPIGRR